MIKNNALHISFPSWFHEFLQPCRYKILYGGRGGGKSWAVADYLLFKALQVNGTILCCREFQNSIGVSVLSLLKDRIEKLELDDYFIVKSNEIICKSTGVNFIFAGLDKNVGSIKSIHNIIYCWIEEGAYISRNSWTVLTPSIRAPNSEIIVTFNPLYEDDVIYNDFIVSNDNLDGFLIKKVSYRDNIFYSKELESERLKDLRIQSNDIYQHIWEGECLKHSEAQIFYNKWEVLEFDEPKGIHAYYGLDFGFSQDPTFGVRCYVHDNILYLSHEASKIGLEIDDTKAFLEKNLPNVLKRTIYADSARPDSISFLKRQNMLIQGVEKGKGSIKDGIEYIKSFDKVIIHPRCKHLIDNFYHYSYKIDERSGEITDKIIDKYSDGIDALRYALEKCMKNKSIDYSKWRKSNMDAIKNYRRFI